MILIDAYWLLYRSRYALDFLHNNQGRPTGMEYGFLRCCEALQKDIDEHIVLCWEGGTWRKEYYPEYKANRKSDIGSDRIADFKKFVNRVYDHAEKPGLEADDVIASLAKDCFIFTNDKDMLQLITDGVVVIKSHKDKKFPWDADRVQQKYYGLMPEQLPKYFAFVGDAVDNIPGVGVRKTLLAAAIRTGGAILQFPMWSTPEFFKLEEFIDSGEYERNLKLVTLTKTDVEIQKAIFDETEIEEWLRMMEIRSLKLSGQVGLFRSDEF